MPPRHVVVDGSNIATEGRTMPSLAQLDQAVREFITENPKDVVTVVVDASFGHRIDPSELPTFEEAEEAGEVVSPPAGAIGRGDAFLLRIAEKTGATVLSNDSFQEFHGDHEWLFEKGRLIGGKPVPGVGWIFMDRTPVRGHKSREVVKEAKRRKREADAPDAPPTKSKARPKSVDRAIARATEEVVEPKEGTRSRRRTSEPPSEPVNEPLAFITFIAAHPLGSEVVGAVVEYSSHGAFVEADGARCYMPLSAMADPPPRKAREVVTKGESRAFVVQAFDPQRRGIELAMPGFAHVTGTPTAETVEAEITQQSVAVKPSRRRSPKAASLDQATGTPEPVGTPGPDEAAEASAPRRSSRRKAAGAELPAADRPAADVTAAETPVADVSAVDVVPPGEAVTASRPARRSTKKAAAASDPSLVADTASRPARRSTAAKKAVAEAEPLPVTPSLTARRNPARKAAAAAAPAPAKARSARSAVTPTVDDSATEAPKKKAVRRSAAASSDAPPAEAAPAAKRTRATKRPAASAASTGPGEPSPSGGPSLEAAPAKATRSRSRKAQETGSGGDSPPPPASEAPVPAKRSRTAAKRG